MRTKTKDRISWLLAVVFLAWFFSLKTHPKEWSEIEAANGQQQSFWFKKKPK